MYRLLKILGVLALVTGSVNQASALTISSQPIFATGTMEDFIFSYSTSTPFTLSDLSFATVAAPSTNMLTTLSPFTSPGGGVLNGTGTLTELIATTPGVPYKASFEITGGLPNSLSVALVPLPASFPLFAMALIGLALIGYRSSRASGGLAA